MTRNRGIDLLRSILPLMVIALHFNNSSGGKAIELTKVSLMSHQFILLLEMLSIGAVNLFIIVSGYCLANNDKRTISKPFRLLLTLSLVNFIFYIFQVF